VLATLLQPVLKQVLTFGM